MKIKLSLRWKISFFLILLVLLSVLLTGWSINKAFNINFKRYLFLSYNEQISRYLSTLEEIYVLVGGWDQLKQSPITHRLLLHNNLLIRLDDSEGNIVFIPKNTGLIRQGIFKGGLNKNHIEKRPIIVNDKMIGTAWFRSPRPSGILTQADLAFQNSINRAIIYSILTLGLIALLLGFWGAYYFTTKRLGQLRQAVAKVAMGNLKVRVNDNTLDEVGELASDFNKMADELVRLESLKRTYLSEIAHELRTPLTTIQSHIEAFLDGILQPDKKSLKILHGELLALTSIIDDLQDLTNTIGPGRDIKLTPINIIEIVENNIEKFLPQSNKVAQILKTEFIPKSAIVLGNRQALNKILGNLISNALKYSSPGGEIIIKVQKESSNIIITIIDQGIGIPAGDLEKIFDQFYRIDPSRSRQTGGTGLGLAIVKKLTETMNGVIQVKSELGKGTTFTLVFPSYN